MNNRGEPGSRLKAYLYFMGGAGNFITGSATLLSIHQDKKVTNYLIDCGLFQGEAEEMNSKFPIDPKIIDGVLLTHSHLDHCGLVALLYKNGYERKVYTTRETKRQTHPIMLDCASINERKANISKDDKKAYKMVKEKLDKKNRRLIRNGKQADIIELESLKQEYEDSMSSALYTIEDAQNAYDFFTEVPVYKPYELAKGIIVKFVPNSHQNGACSIEFYISYNNEEINIAFSGDIGPDESYLYKKFKNKQNDKINYCILESLHGVDERTETTSQAELRLIEYLLKCKREKRVAIIIAFTLDRIALAISIINKLMDKGISISAILDTPMGILQTENYYKSYELGNSTWFKDFGKNPFDTSRFKLARNHKIHMQMLDDTKPNIVLTAQGMGFGGRIIDYFEKYVQREDAAFIFLGYLTEESPGYELCNASQGDLVYLNSRPYKKHCQTMQILGFSGHGNFKEYFAMVQKFQNLKHLILNHGSTTKRIELGEAIKQEKDVNIHIPEMYELYCLTQESMLRIENSELFIAQNEIFNK